MKIQPLLFGLFILFSCAKTKLSKEPKSYTPEQCILQSIRDTTFTNQELIIGYQFVCEGSDTIDQFLFFEDNPWRKIDFPKFPNKNRYVPFGNNETDFKRGTITFDLTKSTYQNVKDKFSISTNEQTGNLIPISAWTKCHHKSYPSDILLVNYILSISGATDTFSLANRQIIHTESQLKVFLSNGEMVYHLISKEYACTGAILDSTRRILFLRTLKPHPDDGITGIEIRDIQDDSILFQLEMDSSFIVIEPKLYDNYAVYEIYTFISTNENDGIRPDQILVFDITNRKMLKRKYERDFKFNFEGISNENIIYSYTDHVENDSYESDTYELDTFKIADMEVISSHTPISQHQ